MSLAALTTACVIASVEPSAAAGGPVLEYVMTIGSQGTEEGHFSYVEDFAFSKDGHLLVTDAAHAWVQAFDKRTGQFVRRFGGKGEDDQSLEKPEGIAVDSDGHVYVADYSSGYIKKYSPAYEWLLTFSEYGSKPGQTMKSEFMDIRGNRLYLPDAGNHRINVFDLSGKFVAVFGQLGTATGSFNVPEAAKFSPDGQLFVTDLRNDRVQVFDTDGTFLRSWGQTGQGQGQFKSPSGLAIDRHGNVFVAEIGNDRIQVFDNRGTFIAAFGARGSEPGQFNNLHGLAIDGETDRLYVADSGNHRVQVFKMMLGR